jgi:hypothetical protein
VRERLRELAAERHRFGYRRLGWLLAREDHGMNRKTPYRIYREQKEIVRRRGRHKRPSARALRSLCPIQAIDGGRSTSYRTHRK